MSRTTPESIDSDSIEIQELLLRVARRWRFIVVVGLITGALALGLSLLIPKKFTARTTILPPQQQQSSAASALASLTSLAALGGAGASLRNPADQYVALMQSVTVMDRIIERFQLDKVYDETFREETRKVLTRNVRMGIGKRDGLITIDVDDSDPKRAAAIANAHVEGLREITNTLAVSEAQIRRKFFEEQLKITKENLTRAQLAVQGSGISQEVLKAEPKAATENYSRLRAQITAAESRLQALRATLHDGAPELSQQLAVLGSLQRELARIELRSTPGSDTDYVSRYREFKYQETLFELFARQYEMARVDESREGALVQTVDPAHPPERPSHPRPVVLSLAAMALAMFITAAYWALRRPG